MLHQFTQQRTIGSLSGTHLFQTNLYHTTGEGRGAEEGAEGRGGEEEGEERKGEEEGEKGRVTSHKERESEEGRRGGDTVPVFTERRKREGEGRERKTREKKGTATS